ncbi:MAG: T9SS type A sorting domain-containing protein [Bacteroidetes bacterium]|nr:T9SS type A sorting domain-containing protein [Bacteroidota bacterium]
MKSVRSFLMLFWLLAFGNLSVIFAQVQGGFAFEGINRTYTVYVPSSYVPGDQFPLLFALHGLTQTGNIMMQFSDFNTYAEQYRFIVVYPDGVGNTWNVGFTGGTNTNDVGFLSALIDTLHHKYDIDLGRVYSTGFSNGGFMSYRLACELGNRIAAIASVAGTMTDGAFTGCVPSRNIPVMHIHGTSDLVVSYNGGFGNKSVDEVLGLWRNFNSCPSGAVIVNLPDLVQEGSTVQTQTWSPCVDSTEVLLYKVINGGHTWPGSVGSTGLGNTNRDIIASEEIWKFVSRFSLDIATGMTLKQTGELIRIYPNPSGGGEISIRFLPMTRQALLEIFNAAGNQIAATTISPGSGSLVIDARRLKPGIYLVRLHNEKVNLTAKLIVM